MFLGVFICLSVCFILWLGQLKKVGYVFTYEWLTRFTGTENVVR